MITSDLTTASGTVEVVDYRYDADGILVSRTEGGQETRFLQDTAMQFAAVVEEYAAAGGALLASYVYGLDLLSQTRGGQQAFFHADALGSTRALTGTAQQITGRYVYDAFGTTIAATGSTANNHLFRGEMLDTAAGAY